MDIVTTYDAVIINEVVTAAGMKASRGSLGISALRNSWYTRAAGSLGMGPCLQPAHIVLVTCAHAAPRILGSSLPARGAGAPAAATLHSRYSQRLYTC